jgi:hypothetical protein
MLSSVHGAAGDQLPGGDGREVAARASAGRGPDRTDTGFQAATAARMNVVFGCETKVID